ncbi:unnamed protein product [Rotaria socialis]|uniref:Peptidase S1 domain-containing protein n=1 Tax=Rotaria socialis TaxID=392032 RepID=A0A820L6X7_9BILA|nr:unnamed protein product [Rotaria socialis]CAF3641462.1 unnamed protein product [Rotaria socialis]CAF3641998.1 unnamed protein product [Rotaria socialis]CAF3668665.1 unnamed protein product [Rotaria socialis]CAF4147244.1 unnamed protein product [Rotaria socialis]
MTQIRGLIFLLTFVKLNSATTYSCNSNSSCGCSTSAATLSRIVGGETAASQTWGWAVSLRLGNALCGGSIIAASWIVTAAHCVSGVTASQVTVYAGSNLLLTASQTRSVSTIIADSSYSSSTYVNDIALLQLSFPLDMTDPRISAICIPLVSASTLSVGEWPSAGTTVVAVGWGRLSEGGSISSTLQQVTLQTVDRQSPTCTPLMNNWLYQFCAAAHCKGKCPALCLINLECGVFHFAMLDTCQGDSGGPLMAFTTSNQWVLVGATSNGIGCAEANSAGIYTRIAAYQSWINTNTGSQFTNPISSTLSSSTTEFNSTVTCTATVLHGPGRCFTLTTILLFCNTLKSI